MVQQDALHLRIGSAVLFQLNDDGVLQRRLQPCGVIHKPQIGVDGQALGFGGVHQRYAVEDGLHLRHNVIDGEGRVVGQKIGCGRVAAEIEEQAIIDFDALLLGALLVILVLYFQSTLL